MSNVYFERYAYPKTLIKQKPGKDLGLVITLPSFKEERLVEALQALASCELPDCAIEVIVVINESVDAPNDVSEINATSFEQALKWAERVNSANFYFHILYINDLPSKHAGVGLARKIAMDEAARRYEHLQKPDGVIVCFDADCLCERNFLVELVNHFRKHQNTPGCSIYFEHPLEGNLAPQVYDAIIDYELFLRYYTNALRFAGFPLAYQTIGSSMAVRNFAYQKQGGMNRRKAGEDFYFLQRIMALGNFTELNTTRVIPSPRISDRVPFGTGRAVKDRLTDGIQGVYAPEIFKDLKAFLNHTSQFYAASADQTAARVKSLPPGIREFLEMSDFKHQVNRIRKHSSSVRAFRKQFFQWFDGFLVLKYIHFARDHCFPNVKTEKAATWLLQQLDPKATATDTQSLLLAFRKSDRSRELI